MELALAVKVLEGSGYTGWVHDGVANQTSIRISDFAFFRSVDLL